jgi:hypothetical protein
VLPHLLKILPLLLSILLLLLLLKNQYNKWKIPPGQGHRVTPPLLILLHLLLLLLKIKNKKKSHPARTTHLWKMMEGT